MTYICNLLKKIITLSNNTVVKHGMVPVSVSSTYSLDKNLCQLTCEWLNHAGYRNVPEMLQIA